MTVALVFQLYLYIPQQDRKKTTMRWGNPHRLDHHILGASVLRTSLYKPPKKPEMEMTWLWDDPGFDPQDILPSERQVIWQIYKWISQEMERVQQDQQIAFPDHYLVGQQLSRQIAFLTTRATYHELGSAELLYYTFAGASCIDLAQLLTSRQQRRRTLKPLYLPAKLSQSQIGDLSRQEEIYELYENHAFPRLTTLAKRDTLTLLRLYHDLNNGKIQSL